MVLVLVAIVIVILAAIVIPPILNPLHEQFSQTSSVNSSYDFSLNLSINSTSVATGGWIRFSAWLNNTAKQVNNVTAQASWAVSGLGPVPCFQSIPIRLGVMIGYFTSDNFSLGSVLPLSYSAATCSLNAVTSQPAYYLFEPLGSRALMITPSGIVQQTVILTVASDGFLMNGNVTSFRDVMTAVAIDEWGDSVLTHFIASET